LSFILDKDTLSAVLKATGAAVDDAQVNAVLKSLKGKKVEDVIIYFTIVN
jgi:ribosomal protein L12E/L44/L45/RPP1/RPP2